jgi:hypothetical protein
VRKSRLQTERKLSTGKLRANSFPPNYKRQGPRKRKGPKREAYLCYHGSTSGVDSALYPRVLGNPDRAHRIQLRIAESCDCISSIRTEHITRRRRDEKTHDRRHTTQNTIYAVFARSFLRVCAKQVRAKPAECGMRRLDLIHQVKLTARDCLSKAARGSWERDISNYFGSRSALLRRSLRYE